MKQKILNDVKKTFALAEISAQTPKVEKLMSQIAKERCYEACDFLSQLQGEIIAGYTGEETAHELGISNFQTAAAQTVECLKGVQVSENDTIRQIAQVAWTRCVRDKIREIRKAVAEYSLNPKDIWPEFDNNSIH